MNEHGVETIKKAVGLVIDLGMAAEDHLSDDGKIKLNEVMSTLASEALEIVDLVRNAGTLVAELKDWDPDEREEVLVWAVDKFDLENDKAEAIIEKALQIIKLAGDIVDLVKG